MGSPSRPDVDALHNLSAAIVVDQERMGANSRSTLGTATDAYTMLRIIFSRIGTPSAGSALAYSFNAEGMCPACEGLGRVSSIDVDELVDRDKSDQPGRDHRTQLQPRRLVRQRLHRVRSVRPGPAAARLHPAAVGGLPAQTGDQDQGQRHQHDVRGSGRQGAADVPVEGPGVGAAAHQGVHRPGGHLRPLPRLRRRPAQAGGVLASLIDGSNIGRLLGHAGQRPGGGSWPRSRAPSVAPVLANLRHTLGLAGRDRPGLPVAGPGVRRRCPAGRRSGSRWSGTSGPA